MESKETEKKSPASNNGSPSAAAGAAREPEKPEDKFKKFEGEGVIIKAKLVGTELVMEPRGDKMCQNSIARLKAIIRGQKAHKQRIVMKINYSGVKIYDEKTNEILHQHEVPQISFIASDDTDSRTFGYVCDVPNKAHQFICFKTSGPAIQVMSVISSLFEAVLEQKKRREEAAAEPAGGAPLVEAANNNSNSNSRTTTTSATKPVLGGKKQRSIFDDDEEEAGARPGALFDPKQSPIFSSDKQPSSPLFEVKQSPLASFEKQPSAAIDVVGRQANSKAAAMFSDDKDPFGDSAIGLKSSKSIDYVFDQFGDLVLGGNNYSSISLNDTTQSAHLPRQSSFAGTTLTNNSASFSHNHSDLSSGGDKYAVFNDIDNFPSIFESTSSLNGSRTKLATNPYSSSASAAPSAFAPLTSHSVGSAGGLNFALPSRAAPPPGPFLTATANAAAAGVAAAATGAAPLAKPRISAAAFGAPQAAGLTRQLTNPFDDDFFA